MSREKTPEHSGVALRLEDAPAKFSSGRSETVLAKEPAVTEVSRGEASGRNATERCSSAVVGESSARNGARNGTSSPTESRTLKPAVKTPTSCPGGIYNEDNDDDNSSLSNNYSALCATPPLLSSSSARGVRSKTHLNPFKVGTRLSLSARKTRTSPRKNIWGVSRPSTSKKRLRETGGVAIRGARAKTGRKAADGVKVGGGETSTSAAVAEKSDKSKITRSFYASNKVML